MVAADLWDMERAARILGIALLVGLFGLSVGQFLSTASSISEQEQTDAAPAVDGEDEDADDIDGPPPEYLALSAGIRPGAYSIADLPDSRDRDYELRIPNTYDADPLDPDLGDLKPGLYATAFDVEGCSFELRRIMRTRTEAVIGTDHLDRGRMLVSINGIEPDSFISSPACGDWFEWSPLLEPLTTVSDGDYWIGDLKPGTWTVPSGCMWEKVVGFRGAKLWDVQDSGFGPEDLVVDDQTLGIRIRGCGQDLRHSSNAVS